MMTPEETSLVERYIDGSLTDSDVEQLESLLAGSGEARALLRSFATLDFGLHELSAGMRVGEATSGNTKSEPMALATGVEGTDAASQSPAASVVGSQDVNIRVKGLVASSTTSEAVVQSRRFWYMTIAVIAASLIVVVGFAMLRDVGDIGNSPIAKTSDETKKVIAILARVSDASWDGDSFQSGDSIHAQMLSLKSGIVRLQFVDGVEVTLQGPAEYEIVDVGHTRLRSGVLAANVPPGAEGFRVETRAADIIDLGTSFGIHLSDNGETNVSVFDGEIEVVSQGDNGKRLLTEGHAIQFAADGQVSEAEFSTDQFEKLWPAASGIAGSTGAFRFVPPWPRRLSRIQSDTEILVLPEGYAGTLEEPCPVDIVESELIESDIPAGRRVRSFLLQFNPVDPSDQETISNSGPGSKMRRIEGSITFDRPVIGLIVSGETLKVTDEIFALRRGPIRPFKRGLELSPPRTADIVSLSEDRQTVTLKLAVFDRFSDHVRVIVDASLSDTKFRPAAGR